MTFTASDFDDFTAQLCLASELDDFDNLVGWVDFTVQVFDKCAEVEHFDNPADFDGFTVQDDGMSKPADRINYSALQPNLRIPPTPVPV